MPCKNVVKEFGEEHYYHVYNRGVAKQLIFVDYADKYYFLTLLDRHLNPKTKQLDKTGLPYRDYTENLELLCYCLMGNHFHMLFYLSSDVTAISELMRSIGAAYTMYYNLKYKRVGGLFQGTYKATRISNDAYLLHITRYIHLNPSNYKTYQFSSIKTYLGLADPEPWLKPGRMEELFEPNEYKTFLENYLDHKKMLKIIKNNLADK